MMYIMIVRIKAPGSLPDANFQVQIRAAAAL